MRKAEIYMHNTFAAWLVEDANGFHFTYEKAYLENENAEAISLTLPLSAKTYTSDFLFPFFDGLIPEGWILDLTEKNWKIDRRDRMAILLVACKDCIGAVSVKPFLEKIEEYES